MALPIPRAPGLPSMIKDGAKYLQGLEEAVYSNIEACVELGKTTRSTFGPSGMNKMVINHIGKLFVTNDAAVILRELEVAHPAAKLMVLASQQQEHEAGDGTNLVIMLAANLLNNASELLKMGLTVTEVAEGYELAAKKSQVILEELVIDRLSDLSDVSQIERILKPVIMTKQFGHHETLTKLISQACISTLSNDKSSFSVDNVRVCKIPGCGIPESELVNGMVFRRDLEGDVRQAKECKVAVFTCPIDCLQTETKGTIRISTGQELRDFSVGEEALVEKQIKDLAEAGIGIVVSGGKVGELALHYLNKLGIAVLRLGSKWDIRRICSALRATALPRLTLPQPDECGYVHMMETREIGGSNVVIFRNAPQIGQTKQCDVMSGCISTIVLRGSTGNVLDNAEGAVDDGVNTFKALSRDARYVAGAGATEMQLATRLGDIADKAPGLEQYAIRKFAQSFEVVVRSLAENYGMRASESLSQLYAAHQKGLTRHGLVIGEESAGVGDAVEAGIVDLFSTKLWAIRFATVAACTVLRVDKIIMAKPAGGPAPKEKQAWDDED